MVKLLTCLSCFEKTQNRAFPDASQWNNVPPRLPLRFMLPERSRRVPTVGGRWARYKQLFFAPHPHPTPPHPQHDQPRLTRWGCKIRPPPPPPPPLPPPNHDSIIPQTVRSHQKIRDPSHGPKGVHETRGGLRQSGSDKAISIGGACRTHARRRGAVARDARRRRLSSPRGRIPSLPETDHSQCGHGPLGSRPVLPAARARGPGAVALRLARLISRARGGGRLILATQTAVSGVAGPLLGSRACCAAAGPVRRQGRPEVIAWSKS